MHFIKKGVYFRIVFTGIFSLLIHCVHGQESFTTHYSDTLHPQRLYLSAGSTIGAYVTGIVLLETVWYKDHQRVPFHYYNDLDGYLQMDKAGHAFSAYRQSYAVYHALRWSGVSSKKALVYGGLAGLIIQTPIELFDGLYEGWGFSWSDMIANTLGSALFAGQQALFNEPLVHLKFSYSPSIYAPLHEKLGTTNLERFFLDYNAHTYWASLALAPLISGLPPWLSFAMGYSADGMIHEFKNPRFYDGRPFPPLARTRQFLFSFDINFTKIKTKKKWLRTVFRTLNLIKIPFPTLEYSSTGKFRFYPMYF